MKERITRSLQQNYHIYWDDRYLMATLIEVGLFDADEDPAISFLSLRERLDRGFFAAYPHMQATKVIKEQAPQQQETLIPEQEKTNPQSLIEIITTCTDIKVLESFKILVRNKPEEKKAYDEMYIKLTQK